MKPNELSATAALKTIRAGQLSAEALVRSCLDRISLREPAVAAWQFLDEQLALNQARAVDRAPGDLPLRGIPIGVKDIIDTADMPTEYGSPIYRNHRPTGDAATVAVLRRAGAVMLGKTVTTEFAYFEPGKTRNPHDQARTPGGSSSGSAAAVADFMVPIAFGTQTGGSIIRPASFCGAIGYKPSYDSFSRDGVKPLAHSMDTVGFFARSVDDLALVASVLAPAKFIWPLPAVSAAPRIGQCRTPFWPLADSDARAALDDAANRLRAAGCVFEEITLPPEYEAFNDMNMALMGIEAAQNCARELREHPEQVSRHFHKLAENGYRRRDEYKDLLSRAAEGRRRFAELFGACDVLLTPSAPCAAPRLEDGTGDPAFNRLWTLLHPPCLNVPAWANSQGLPVGVQLVGRAGEDRKFLSIAKWIVERLIPVRV